MVLCFLKIFGKGKEELVMVIIGFLVFIFIFCDLGFVILILLIKVIFKEIKKLIVFLGLVFVLGLVIIYFFVLFIFGLVGVVGIFGVSVLSIILYGIIILILMVLVCLVFVKYVGNKIW